MGQAAWKPIKNVALNWLDSIGRMDSTPSISVPVLGMHRSGTSMVSRMLEAGGVSFGSDKNLAGPGADNELGYWENLEIRSINEELLERYGGDWRCPPAFSADAFSGKSNDDLRERARASLDLLSASASCWSMKDPRMSLLLSFWQPLLSSPPRAVLCLRHPFAVAASLSKRNHISKELAGFLWQEYTASACKGLVDVAADVLVVSYEQVLENPQTEVQRWIRFFAGFNVELNEEAMVEAVNVSLNHAPQEKFLFPELDPAGHKLYEQLQACATNHAAWSSIDPVFPHRDPRFCALMKELSALASELDKKSAAYTDRIQETVTARSALKHFQEEQEAQQLRLEGELKRELEAERAHRDNLQGRLEFRLGSALRRLLRR